MSLSAQNASDSDWPYYGGDAGGFLLGARADAGKAVEPGRDRIDAAQARLRLQGLDLVEPVGCALGRAQRLG